MENLIFCVGTLVKLGVLRGWGISVGYMLIVCKSGIQRRGEGKLYENFLRKIK